MALRARVLLKSISILAAAVAVFPNDAVADANYPDKAVKIIVGLPPGGAPDTTARLLAEKFQDAWGRPVVVENVAGAAGNIAADRVAKSAPDGYTLLLAGNASIVVNLNLYEKLAYDPVQDLVPISLATMTPNILAVHPDVPAKSVAELAEFARAKPDVLTYGHGGVGISQHLAGELFKHMGGLAVQGVSYRGAPAIMPDLLAGRLSYCFCNITNVLPLAQEGKLRALAVTSLKRSPSAPDLPTMAEFGFPGFDATAWFGLMAPAGTPPAIVRETSRGDGEGSRHARRARQVRRHRHGAGRQFARRICRRDPHRDSLLGKGNQSDRAQAEVGAMPQRNIRPGATVGSGHNKTGGKAPCP